MMKEGLSDDDRVRESPKKKRLLDEHAGEDPRLQADDRGDPLRGNFVAAVSHVKTDVIVPERRVKKVSVLCRFSVPSAPQPTQRIGPYEGIVDFEILIPVLTPERITRQWGPEWEYPLRKET
jgi:hypothetical protein